MTSHSVLSPSSATAGFFQSLPHVPPQYTSVIDETSSTTSSGNDDPIISRLLALYLPTPLPEVVDRSLHDLARTCLAPSTLRLCVDAETNLPTLHPLGTFGQTNHLDALRTGEGWRGLKDLGIRSGSVALAYSLPDASSVPRWNRRIHQFAVNHLWSASSALVTCPAAMSDGAAVLLGHHLDDPDGDQPGRAIVLAEARRRLVSFDPTYAWTSGQWMTERVGGSDVRETQTVATRLDSSQITAFKQQNGLDTDNVNMPLGPWQIDGFKWFSSATDADMVVLLARTSKGISAFYAPMRRMSGGVVAMNGVRITRLKQKLGTKALPTSELEIKGMRAWLIGDEGKGIREIGSILNLTRLWTASGAVSGWARGLAISRSFAQVRVVKGELLMKNTQHLHWMADETVKYRASAHFAFLGAALQGIVEQGVTIQQSTAATAFLPNNQMEVESLLRILTPVMKAQCSLASVDGLRACMESLGGVGYCENNEDGGIMNVARLFRDVNVNPIWEGTVSVMAEDLIRVAKGKHGSQSLQAIENLIQRMLNCGRSVFMRESLRLQQVWRSVAERIRATESADLLYDGRNLLRSIESIVCASLLMVDAARDHNESAIYVAKRWIALRFPEMAIPEDLRRHREKDMDSRIFLGNHIGKRGLGAHI